MSKTKNKYSTSVVKSKNGKVICYLSSADEENGVDIQMDLLGYIVITL